MRRTPTLHGLDHELLNPLFRKYSVGAPPITHYTTVATLGLILSTRNLRMTHFRHLNDSTEMLHGRRVINQLFRAEVQRASETSAFFDYCRFLFNEVDDTAIQYFVTSFSADDDRPELWSAYGDTGSGVAIVFDTARMGAEAVEPAPYHIATVTYSETEQLQLVSPLIYAIRRTLAPYIRAAGHDLFDPTFQRVAEKLCSHLNHHSISLKERKWRVEHEWRTVFSVLQNDSDERKTRVQFRSDGRPFIDVPIISVAPPDERRLPILRVRAGTAADVSAIRAVLDTHGYGDVAISQSKVPGADLPAWPPRN